MADFLACCCDKASDKYAPVDPHYSTLPEAATALELSRSHSVDCPTHNGGLPHASILIKTGGTALQEVPRESALDPDMISVSVPEGIVPGQKILVTHPDGTGRCMRATVPEGALPGHSFLVKFTSEAGPVGGAHVEQHLVLSVDNETANDESATASQENCVSVVGTRVTPQDLHQTQVAVSSGDMVQSQTTSQTSSSSGRQDSIRKNSLVHHDSVTPDGRVLITTPYGSKPGDKIRVRHEDGRVIETTIPKELPSQFYVKIPSTNHQNWHDNPVVAGAPLLAGPFFGI